MRSLKTILTFSILAAALAAPAFADSASNYSRFSLQGRKLVWEQPRTQPDALTGQASAEARAEVEPKLRARGRAGYVRR